MRALTAPLVLAAAVGVPYAATNAPDMDEMWSSDSKPAAANTTLKTSAPTYGSPPGSTSPVGSGAAVSAVPQRSFSLAEVIRFDVNKSWVFQRWQRKTTSLAELDLFGVRVPLVTGTALHDLAGSLTYYFDPQGHVQRISLLGRTGNTTQLEMLVTQRYGLQLQGTPIAGQRVYRLLQGEDVVSELVIRPSSVMRSDTPHESFQVDMRLQRPGSITALPPRTLPLNSVNSKTQGSQAKTVASSEQSTSEQAAQQTAAAEEEKSDEPYWRAYMPRSSVPAGQIENLDRNNRF